MKRVIALLLPLFVLSTACGGPCNGSDSGSDLEAALGLYVLASSQDGCPFAPPPMTRAQEDALRDGSLRLDRLAANRCAAAMIGRQPPPGRNPCQQLFVRAAP